MLIELKKIEPIKDPRGNVYAFPFANRNHLSVIHRRAGTVSADHYHEGKTQSKSPETFYLAQGTLQLLVRENTTGQEEVYMIEQGYYFSIPPNVYHKVTAVTDVILLEFNIAEEDFTQDVVKD